MELVNQNISNISALSQKVSGLHLMKLKGTGTSAERPARFIPISPSNSGTDDDENIKKSCDDFEAIMLNFLLAEMKKTVEKTNLFGDDNFASQSFNSMLDSEISKSITKSGGLGISESMFNQLTNQPPYSIKGPGYGK